MILFFWRNFKTLMTHHNTVSQFQIPRLALLALLLPVAGFGTSIQVSSLAGATVCETSGGTCPDPNSTLTAVGISPAGASTSGSFSFAYYVSNQDSFKISGTYSASYSTGTLILFNPTVTYIGNNGNTLANAVGADSISLDLYQNFYDTTGTSWNGTVCEYFPAAVATGGTESANLSFDGQSVGTLTAGAGSSAQSKCSALSYSAAQNASAYLNGDYNITFNFAAGTTPGTSSSSVSPSSVPEPSTAALGLLGSFSLLYFARRSRRSN